MDTNIKNYLNQILTGIASIYCTKLVPKSRQKVRGKLFAGTVPENKKLFAGTVPANKELFAGTVLVRKDGFRDNGSYTYICVRAIFDSPDSG